MRKGSSGVWLHVLVTYWRKIYWKNIMTKWGKEVWKVIGKGGREKTGESLGMARQWGECFAA